MIIEFIIIALISLLGWLFSFLNFISLPVVIVDGLSSVVNFMMVPFGVVANYLGTDFLSQILVIIFIIYPLLYAYLFAEWILIRLKIIGG